jgi:hypothetical protein
MIEENRRFWSLVAMETDNTGEWVPNDTQTSGLGLMMPPGTGDRWQAVLADAEKALKGEASDPPLALRGRGRDQPEESLREPARHRPCHLHPGRGPSALTPRRARRCPMQSWRDFEDFVQGDAMLFAVFLN